jgi:hypothetical protein
MATVREKDRLALRRELNALGYDGLEGKRDAVKDARACELMVLLCYWTQAEATEELARLNSQREASCAV